MSNPTLASRAFKPAAPVLAFSLLRELFAATPLSILASALQPTNAKPLQH